jgi:hypothetical protein
MMVRGGRMALVAALVLAVSTGIAAGAASVVEFGETLLLSGTVPSGGAGARVTVLERPFGKTRFTPIATVRTTGGGRWRYRVTPRIHTTYRAAWQGIPSRHIVADVAPRLDVDMTNGVVTAKATAARSFEGKYVVLQLRRPGTRWRAVRKLFLDERSTARARQKLPLGRSELRVLMPRDQASPGYVGSVSPTFTFINNRGG